jgi:hypothetical protein
MNLRDVDAVFEEQEALLRAVWLLGCSWDRTAAGAAAMNDALCNWLAV